MAAAAIEVIGVISGLLGIVQFGIDNIPEQETSQSTLMIGVGLDGTDPAHPDRGSMNSAGGDLPDVRLWNENVEFIAATADPGTVDSGEANTITVDQGDNGQQPTYALLSANDDAICIAFVSITMPEPAKQHYAWLGDWGAECGATWFYSRYLVDGKNYRPMCTWIDANGDQPTTGLSMHFPSFVGSDPSAHNASDYCSNTQTFQIHTEEDPSAIPIGGDPLRKRSFDRENPLVGNSRRFAGRLVVSRDADNHKTERLCNTANSVGPDFLNLAEGQFCNMQDKTLWPVCSNQDQTDCFDVDTKQLVQTGVKGIRKRSAPYSRIDDWTSE
jgi:hypothetical protein